ncbi:MAG TPA: flagellar biosynthetic protein FliO, partial [Spirochaetota bacterium]
MKRFYIIILLALSGLMISGTMMASRSSGLYAQDRKKSSARHEANTPRQVVDFTGKKEKETKSDATQSASADSAKGEDAAASTDKNKKEPSLYNYEQPKEEESSYGWMIIKTILVLGFFGAGFYFFFKYITKRGIIPNIGRSVVQTIAVNPVGQNKTIQVVEVAGRMLIIGVTDSQISLISEITAKDEIDRIRLHSSKSTPVETHTFQDFVSEQVGSLVSFIGKTRAYAEQKKKNRTRDNEEIFDDGRVDYMREQRERL